MDFVDEQELQDRFVSLCGGTASADRLQQIWNGSYPHQSAFGDESKVEVFRKNARREGFTARQIEAFLKLP